jgi:HAD superfamily hydrolase (TIGR01549 family)
VTSSFQPPTPIRAILFDAGGTLIHLDGERVCGAAGLPFEAQRFREAESAAVAAIRAFMLENRESKDAERVLHYFDHMLTALGVADAAARREAGSRVAAEHRRANLWSRAGARAAETLAELAARRYRMAVVSNADGRVRGLLEAAGVLPWLEFVVDSAEVGLEKPDPRIFHAATDRLGLPPAACAYVGDIYEIDVEGARRAGLQPVLIGDGPAPGPVARVADLAELLPLFPGILR